MKADNLKIDETMRIIVNKKSNNVNVNYSGLCHRVLRNNT